MWWFFCEGYGDHRDLHVLTHSFPTRRSSDLAWGLTAHWAIWANHNLLLLDPLCLLLVPAWLMSARATWRPRRWQRGLAVLIALLATLSLPLLLLSGTQQNLPWIGLMLPIQLTLAWVIQRAARTD